MLNIAVAIRHLVDEQCHSDWALHYFSVEDFVEAERFRLHGTAELASEVLVPN